MQFRTFKDVVLKKMKEGNIKRDNSKVTLTKKYYLRLRFKILSMF